MRSKTRVTHRQCVSDERACSAHESRRAREPVLLDFDWQVVAGAGLVKLRRLVTSARHHHAQREAFDSLVPVEESRRNIGVLQIFVVGAEEDTERLAPSGVCARVDYAVTDQRGMGQQADYFTARKTAARHREEQFDGFGNPAGARQLAANQIDWNFVQFTKDTFDVRKVLVERGVGNHDCDFVARNLRGFFLRDQRFVLAKNRPDRVRDDLGLSADSGTSEKSDPPIIRRTLAGLDWETHRLAIEDALLEPIEKFRLDSCCEIRKERNEIALRKLVEDSDVFAARPPPEP